MNQRIEIFIQDRPFLFVAIATLSTSIIGTIIQNLVFKLIYLILPSVVDQSFFLIPVFLQFIIQFIILIGSFNAKRNKIIIIILSSILIIIGPILSFYTTYAVWYWLGLPAVDMI